LGDYDDNSDYSSPAYVVLSVEQRCFVMSNKEYWRFIIKRFLAISGILLILLFVALPVYASSWVTYFPIYITDTSGTNRTNVAVLTGLTGTALNNGGFINANGTNTNMQQGSSNISYTMGTTQIGVFLPTISAYSTQEIDLYTGYSPAQTSFPIIIGNSGNFTTTNNAAFDLGNSGNYTFSGWFNPTSTGYLLNNPNSCVIQGTGSGNISFITYGTGAAGTTYPSIRASSNGSMGASISTTCNVTLPTGHVAGDMLIAQITAYGGSTGDYSVTPATGWTQIYWKTYNGGSSYYYGTGAWYITDNGSATSPAVFTLSKSSYTGYIAICVTTLTYSGTPVSGTAASDTNSNPDPPSLTSGFGAVDTLWLASVGSTQAQTTYSTGFTLLKGQSYNSGYTYISAYNGTVATVDPSAWSTSASWASNTIALKGWGIYTVMSGIVSAAEHVIQCYISGGNIGIKIDGDAAITTAFTSNITASSATMTWMSSNIFVYCNYITVYKSGVQSVLFQPTAIISGTNLPDSVSGCNGTINWGTNSGLTISYGAIQSYSSTSSNASAASGNFSPPSLTLGSNWYASGNLSDQSPWNIFSSLSQSAGMGGKTILMFVAIGVAMILGMLVFKSSGSVLISTILIGGTLYFFSEMSIIPFAMVFIFLIISIGIMYLVRLI
jgi:hypothetical protein